MLRAAALLVFLFATCATELPPSPMAILENTRLVNQLEMATIAPAAALQSRARLIWPDTVCQARGGRPIFVLPPQNPRVGHEVAFSLLATWLEPRDDVTLFVTTGPRLLTPVFDLDGAGAPGCKLMVAWTAISALPAGAPSGTVVDGVWFKVGPGRWDFRWTPAAKAANQRLYVQAGLLAPKQNRAGLLTTAAIELWIAP
jgi:hypothetical protein